jgi:hypothetical protein
MDRDRRNIGPKQLASITALGLAIGVATFMILFNSLLANSDPTRLDDTLDRFWAKISTDPDQGLSSAGFSARVSELTQGVTGGSATVTVPLITEIGLSVTGASVTIPINVLDVPSGDLGAYQFKIYYDDSVIEASTVSGGEAPFNGVTAFNVTTTVTGGVVAWNTFQGGSIPVPTTITVANVVFLGVGSVGECSPLDLAVEELVNNAAVAIDNGHQDGEICLVATSADAETDLVAAQDVDDVALPTGVKPTIDLIKDFGSGDPLPTRKISSYEANITFPPSQAQATDCRLKAPFDEGVTDCAISSGLVHMQATSFASGSGTAAPIDPLAFVALRLTGSNNPVSGLTTVDLNFVEIKDEFDGLVNQESPPDTRTFLRGDALANGNISISDALFIAQHLVAPVFRPAGEAGGEVNPVNAGSVNDDSPNDVISLADAILIAQFLVGNVDEFYDPVP